MRKEQPVPPKAAAPSKTEPSVEKSDEDAAEEEDSKALSAAESSLLTKVLRARLVVTKTNVEVLRRDPNSPLYSVKSFDELNLQPDLLKGVYGMGFSKPSKIQETALPLLLAKPSRNLIAQSQSGTGKTAAFVLALLSKLDTTRNYPQVICLSPTFDLACQTGEVVKQMAKYCPTVRISFAVRGERVPRGTKIDSHVIIGTPGTTLDWVLKLRVFDPKKISVFVLDEADVMIDTQGHQDQTIRIYKTLSQECQMMLFSATFDDKVMKFAETIIPDPIILRLKREEESLDNIKQYFVTCSNEDDKFKALANIYSVISIGQAMVFCRTRKSAMGLAAKMTKEGHAVALLTGESTPEQRIAVLNRFRDGKEKVLITTNLMARGIDIEQITMVVNYDLPVDLKGQVDFETYLHRIGRTGRFGKSGLAINFVDGHRSFSHLQKIETHFGKKIEQLKAEDVEEIEEAVGDGQ